MQISNPTDRIQRGGGKVLVNGQGGVELRPASGQVARAFGPIQSNVFTSSLQGWRIEDGGDAEFNNVVVRGALRTGTLMFNAVQATNGTLLVTKAAAKLRQDVTVGGVGSSVTVAVDDPEGLAHAQAQVFAVGDFLRIRQASPSGVADTWLEVTAVTDATTHWEYTCTVRSGGSVTYYKGAAVADYGTVADGGVLIDAATVGTPRLDVFTNTATPWSSGFVSRARLGNLKGWGPFTTDVYGLALGDYAGNKYLFYRSDTSALEIRGTIKADDGYLGTLDVSGTLTIQTSGKLVAGTTSTGTVLDSTGLVGLNAGTVQVQVRSSDGSLSAGGGVVLVNSAGLRIDSTPTLSIPENPQEPKTIKFVNPQTGKTNGVIYATRGDGFLYLLGIGDAPAVFQDVYASEATPSLKGYTELWWDPTTSKAGWRFVAQNVSPESPTTLIRATKVVGSRGLVEIDADLAVGTNPAQSGLLRLPNNQPITARNAANTADVSLILLDSADKLYLRGGALTIDNSGNVGIGTTSPADRLHLASGHFILGSGGVPNNTIKFGDGSFAWIGKNVSGSETRLHVSGFPANGSSGTRIVAVYDRLHLPQGSLRIDNTISSTWNAVEFGTQGTLYSYILGGQTSGTGGAIHFVVRSSSDGNYHVRMAILDQGTVGIGTTSISTYRLDVNGDCHAASFPTSSDARFKQNVQPLTNVLPLLRQIRGVRFEWSDYYARIGRQGGRGPQIGVIAQEVQRVFPELVSDWGDEAHHLGLDYGRFTAVLLEGLKELLARVETLERRLQTLSAP